MLTSDYQVADGEVLEIALTHGNKPVATFRFTSDSFPPVRVAWRHAERERGERLSFERFFTLALEKSVHGQQAERRQSCAICDGPCLD